MRRLAAACAAGFAIAMHLSAPATGAQAGPALEPRSQTPSGQPVPRFVSLKSDETFCRSGPSFDHPVAARYVRAGAPVLVIAETTDHWRKIRDIESGECWVHQTMLSAVSHVIVREDTEMRTRPAAAAPVRARLARGVLAKIERREGEWLKITAGRMRGWARREALWGADVSVASHN